MKEVSRTTFVGAHVGVIGFHVLIGVLVLWALSRKQVGNMDSLQLIRILMYALIIVSLLGLWPIVNKTDYVIAS